MNKNQVRLAAACCCAFGLAATPGTSDAQDDLSAAFVYVGPVGDAGWTYRHDQGRQCLEQKTGIKTAFVESVPETPDVANVERDFLAQGYDLIFATAFGYQRSPRRSPRRTRTSTSSVSRRPWRRPTTS